MKSFLITIVICWGVIPLFLAIYGTISCKISMNRLDRMIHKIKNRK